MQKPFFSVVIPTLNEEKHLPNLLNDLAKQTYQNFDVYVVDARSEDKTPTLVKEYGKKHPNVHLIQVKTRHVSAQRNAGAKKSTADHIMFLDADTRLPAYFFEGTHYQLMRKPILIWIHYTSPETKDPKDRLFANLFNLIMDAGSNTSYPIAAGACIGCKRDAFTKIGGFDETVTISEDLIFLHAAVEAGYAIELMKEPRYVFCMRRQRKEGYFSLTAKIIPIVIKTIQGKKISDPVDVYPMLGGTYFLEHKKDPKLKSSLKKNYGRLSKAIRKHEKELRQELREVIGDF